jgi:hypothetical protein
MVVRQAIGFAGSQSLVCTRWNKMPHEVDESSLKSGEIGVRVSVPPCRAQYFAVFRSRFA